MSQNDPDLSGVIHGSDFSCEIEVAKNQLIKRLTFELDRDEAEPGCGRDRDIIFRELNEALGLSTSPSDSKPGGHDMTIVDKSNLTDADLEDMGGRRCACGEPVFQLGIPNEQHCELDTK